MFLGVPPGVCVPWQYLKSRQIIIRRKHIELVSEIFSHLEFLPKGNFAKAWQQKIMLTN